MSKNSLTIKELGENDCLFSTHDCCDGSLTIGTNFTSDRTFRMTEREAKELRDFLNEEYPNDN